MNTKSEKGMAMIMTLIFVAVLSAMAVSFMFLSQAETWSTMNYRFMNQARDGAEAGVNVAANHLLNTYVPPTTGGGDPISAYTITTSPVAVGGNPVVLSASTEATANYPASAVQTAFNTEGQGTFTAGTATVRYRTFATLLAMRQVTPYGNTCPDGTPAPCTIQTWRITGEGSIANIRNAEVEVDTVLERPIQPTFGYAAFGTSQVCSPEGLRFAGGGTTDSYDSSCILTTCPGTQSYGGNVGTNGNMTLGGSTTTINGSLSTPRSGVGSCASGAAETVAGGATLTDGITGLPQTIAYQPPAAPVPATTGGNDNIVNDAGCNGTPGCTVTAANSLYTLTPTCASTNGVCAAGNTPTYRDLSLGGGGALVPHVFQFTAGTYNINSISLTSSNASISILSGPVIFNIGGVGLSSGQDAVSLAGGSVTNATLNPLNLQIQYAGTNGVQMAGGTGSSAVIYAPNATVTITGGSDFYGSVIGYSVNVPGGAHIHYDRNLQNTAYTIGNYSLSGFTWKKF
jgi:hypothetical protein